MHRLLLTAALAFAACSAGGATDDGFTPDDGSAPPDQAMSGADLAGADLAIPPGADLAVGPDLSHPFGPGPKPMGGTVGPTGGKVDRLYFTFHGDTRPMSCNDANGYPTTIITSIFNREAGLDPEFGLDLGDHMFVCSGTLNEAQTQMGLYMNAAKNLPKTLFMTMGNHECSSSASYCYLNSTQPNYKAFMAALAPVSTVPYYTFDVQTDTGLATFVVVADNAWDTTESSWLTTTLTKADGAAKYTIVMRHHPIDNVDLATMMDEWNIIKSHKYSLFLTGHTHEYKHDLGLDGSGRTGRMGNAGAPLDNNFPYYGYGVVQQGIDDRLYVFVYDQATGNQMDTWSVPPQ
jgi:hypothetical protein